MHRTTHILCALAFALVLHPHFASAQGLIAIRGAVIETVGKEGTLENGTLLVRNGKIEAIGKEIDIPVSARIVDGRGLTIIPGIVDPYYVVQVARSAEPATETRTVVVRGRSFNIGGGSPAIPTSFARIADGITMSTLDWQVARRSGITNLHIVTGGYAQSLFAQQGPPGDNERATAVITEPNGKMLVTVSNDSRSLDVVRNGLKDPQARGGGGRGAPAASGSSSGASSSGMPASGAPASSAASQAAASANSAPPSGSSELWKQVREGKSPMFVNVNNAASILHTLTALKEAEAAKVAFIASGADIFVTLEDLDPARQTIVLPPRLDTIPNSANLVNVPKLLAEKKIPFAFSTSLGQSDFRNQQDTPLFGVGLLVRAGLDRNLALEALTLSPAKLLGLDASIGTLEVGKLANFIVLDGDPFATTTGIKVIFVDGKPIYEN